MIQSKSVARVLTGLLVVGVLGFVSYQAYIVLFSLFTGEGPPPWSYGEGKFARFKPVASRSECTNLIALLEAEKVEDFNRARTTKGFSGRYLDLKELRLIGKDLAGVDLSKCILTDCDFSGSDLRGASFKHSYVAQTTFLGPFWLQNGAVSTKMGRITDLRDAHFDGATLRATADSWVEIGYAAFPREPNSIHLCTIGNTTGISDLHVPAYWDIPIKVTPLGPQVTPPAGPFVTNFADVSIPCPNPFADIPDAALQEWAGMNVDIQRLRKMPARQLKSSAFTMPINAVVNSDSNMVTVVTDPVHGLVDIVSAGPQVVMNGAYGFRRLLSESTVWIRDDVSPNDLVIGHPVVLSSVRRQALGRTLVSPVYLWSGPSALK